MKNEFTLSSGQAHELELTFRKYGWTNGDVKKLCSQITMTQVLPFVRGNADIVVREHVIDTDKAPDLRGGSLGGHDEIEEHTGLGQLKWDPSRVKLHISTQNTHDTLIGAAQLHEEMKGKQALNLNVLLYLLQHETLIPAEWQPKTENDPRVICFWGTVIRRVSHGDEKFNHRVVETMVWVEASHTWMRGAYSLEQMQGQQSWIPKNTASAYLAS